MANPNSYSRSRMKFYDLLDVKKGASEHDLKRAYKKKALSLHPDKHGGDGEPFKKMKYAYDVLLDPKKRSAYDKYGEPGVRAAEGDVSPEVAMEIFFSIGVSERLCLLIALTLFTSFVLLFPVLLCIKWDHPKALTFTQAFIPIWFMLSATCLFCCCCVQAPTANDDEDDAEIREQVDEVRAKTLQIRVTGYCVVVILTLLSAFLTLRLDHRTRWSFFAVLWPWMLLELGGLMIRLYSAEYLFVLQGGSQEILGGGRWLRPEWLKFVGFLTYSNIIHFYFAYLLASKLDGTDISWWTVFTPKWIGYGIEMLHNFSLCSNIKSQAELDQLPEELRKRELTRSQIVCNFMFQAISLLPAILLCRKLDKPAIYPAWVVFLPIFVSATCMCCCCSCLVCCSAAPSEEDFDDVDLEATLGRDAGGYGSTDSTMPPTEVDV